MENWLSAGLWDLWKSVSLWEMSWLLCRMNSFWGLKMSGIRMYFMGICLCIYGARLWSPSSNCHFNGFTHYAEKVAGGVHFLKVCMWEAVETVFSSWSPTQPIGIVILPQPVTSVYRKVERCCDELNPIPLPFAISFLALTLFLIH